MRMNRMQEFSRTVLVLGLLVLTGITSADAARIEKISCSAIPDTRRASYDATITCTAEVSVEDNGQWYSVAGQDCSLFCKGVGGYSSPSKDGYTCVSGEKRLLARLSISGGQPCN
jgi:hypothetical protein